jgi:hypothetical protein
VNVAVLSVVVAGAAGGPVRIVVTGGPMTVNVYEAGVASTFSLESTARTCSVC